MGANFLKSSFVFYDLPDLLSLDFKERGLAPLAFCPPIVFREEREKERKKVRH